MDSERRKFLEMGGALIASPGLAWLAAAQEPDPYTCPMHAEVLSKQPGQCPKCGMKLVPRSAPPLWTCTMHLDVMSPEPGSCPRCQMKLTRVGEVEAREFQVRIETSPSPPQAGRDLRMRFTVHHPDGGRQVRKFNILHDMPFHLFIVSQDFESFDHIHPALQPDGSLVIETRLPKPGYYRIFCDFFPEGGMPQVSHQHLVTAGFKGDLVASLARLVPDVPRAGRYERTIDGTRFELTFDPERLYAGQEYELRYRLFDQSSGRPIEDLRPYLAAWGHTLILSEDGTEYLHSHPTEMLPEGLSQSRERQLKGRSEVVFDTFFPRPSRYRIWSQFQRGERLITVPFTIDLPRLD
ncbi:MAG: hypothetical protein RIR52_1519 [Acidobacteriota bacterium]|jgi:hypothetical protein